MKALNALYILFLLLVLNSCSKKYSGNVILKTEEEDINWSAEYSKTLQEYILRAGDKIQYSIYTNKGEAIIDPTGLLVQRAQIETDDNVLTSGRPVYEVSEAGTAFFPVVGLLKIINLKVSELDSLLSAEYEKYYNEVFVISKIINKRVIVLGGKQSKVIPLEHPNMSLLEIIAVFGGLDNDSKGFNIRIVRGDLKNPEITVVNLRTVADMKASIVRIKPDDIIYIEPIRKPVSEAAREYMFVFQMVNILFTLTILVERISSR